MFNNIGTTELIILAAILLLLFGGKKLPELTRGIGNAVKEFRKGLDDDDSKK
jgi:sec-independent protein translocase protein TatA